MFFTEDYSNLSFGTFDLQLLYLLLLFHLKISRSILEVRDITWSSDVLILAWKNYEKTKIHFRSNCPHFSLRATCSRLKVRNLFVLLMNPGCDFRDEIASWTISSADLTSTLSCNFKASEFEETKEKKRSCNWALEKSHKYYRVNHL